MKIGARKTASKSSDQPKPGTYMARLVGIVDLGLQPAFEFSGGVAEAAYKITLTYELPSSKMQDGRPHWVSEDIKNSDFYDDKKGISSTLMKRVYALDPDGSLTHHGKDITPLINLPCMVEVGLNKNGYIKIKNVTGAPAGIPVGELANEPILFSPAEPDVETFRRLPPFTQDKIKRADDFLDSPLYPALLAEGLLDEDDDNGSTEAQGY
jgi:hypothetical protein